MMTQVKTDDEIAAMRDAGGMLGAVLNLLDLQVTAGMSGRDASELARNELKKLGGHPSFLGYQGFPDIICISVNDAVVHGIPNDTPFADGDVVSFDFGVTVNRMITDSAFTKIVGGSAPKSVQKLVAQTEAALLAGVDVVKDGVRTGDIAAAIQRVLDAADLGIVRDLVGHGVGHQLHEEPNFPNFGTAGTGSAVKTGMTIALEPMAMLGDHPVTVDRDGWTIRAKDKSIAAHFEHTILVTDQGAEMLTERG